MIACPETLQLTDAYLDDELELRGALELEEHLAGCSACSAEERGLRELQASVRANLVRHAAPPSLEARLREALQVPAAAALAPAAPRSAVTPALAAPAAALPRPPAARRWAGLAASAAAATLAAMVVLVAAPRLRPPPAEIAVADVVIAAHVRSLLANHLTDVASSDQHTVKPWFQGKLDYSVSVTDFAAEGYPLVGGRLDYVEDAPVASLVYRRAQHVVNLFVWPGRRGGDEPLQHLSRRGYGAFWWSKDGMYYWAVSDLNDAELQRFVELVRHDR